MDDVPAAELDVGFALAQQLAFAVGSEELGVGRPASARVRRRRRLGLVALDEALPAFTDDCARRQLAFSCLVTRLAVKLAASALIFSSKSQSELGAHLDNPILTTLRTAAFILHPSSAPLHPSDETDPAASPPLLTLQLLQQARDRGERTSSGPPASSPLPDGSLVPSSPLFEPVRTVARRGLRTIDPLYSGPSRLCATL